LPASEADRIRSRRAEKKSGAGLLARLLLAGVAFVAPLLLVESLLAITGVSPIAENRDPLIGFSTSARIFQASADGRFFETTQQAAAQSFNHQKFLRRKPPNGLRIFAIGGSSVYGYPWGASVAFTQLLGEGLSALTPERVFEAVNVGGMSYASHRLRIVVAEILDYEPDLIVLYGGHNEFVESQFYADFLERNEALDPMRALLGRSRLYSAARRLAARLAGGGDDGPDARGRDLARRSTGELLGLRAIRQEADRVTDSERAVALDRFEANVEAILESAAKRGVGVVLCTVASNLRDWQPNQSLHAVSASESDREDAERLLQEGRRLLERDHFAQARSALEAARSRSPGFAAIHFDLGRAYEGERRLEDAAQSYRRARDLDAQPARASSELNARIRTLASAHQAILVDVEKAIAEQATGGLVGFEWIEDYVHPSRRGHEWIARTILQNLLGMGIVESRVTTPLADFDALLADRRASPPEVDSKHRAAMLFNTASILTNQGRFDQAISQYREIIEFAPGHSQARLNLGLLLERQGLGAEALPEYALVEGRPETVAWARLGMARLLERSGERDEALVRYHDAVELAPSNATAWQSLAEALGRAGHVSQAEAAFRSVLEIDPKSTVALRGLGMSLAEQGHSSQARAILERVLLADPGDRLARARLDLLEKPISR